MNALLKEIVAHHRDPEDRYEAALAILDDLRSRRARAAFVAANCKHVCPKCSRSLTHAAFNKSARRPCGIDWRCAECARAARRAAAAATG